MESKGLGLQRSKRGSFATAGLTLAPLVAGSFSTLGISFRPERVPRLKITLCVNYFQPRSAIKKATLFMERPDISCEEGKGKDGSRHRAQRTSET